MNQNQIAHNGAVRVITAISPLITALTPILLAAITYFTIVNGNKSAEAAHIAEQTRQHMVRTDSVQGIVLDTIHGIVNSQRTRMQGQNEALRVLLENNKIPVPVGLIADEVENHKGKVTQDTTLPNRIVR
jgi:hypothetical protein